MCIMKRTEAKEKRGYGYKVYAYNSKCDLLIAEYSANTEHDYLEGAWYEAGFFPHRRMNLEYDPGFHIYKISRKEAIDHFGKRLLDMGYVRRVQYDDAFVEGVCKSRELPTVVAKKMRIIPKRMSKKP